MAKSKDKTPAKTEFKLLITTSAGVPEGAEASDPLRWPKPSPATTVTFGTVEDADLAYNNIMEYNSKSVIFVHAVKLYASQAETK